MYEFRMTSNVIMYILKMKGDTNKGSLVIS